ncbi:MAG: carboxypeptidase regulatory-like domain-containing protein [Bacteroidaceae bacterium]|nr:carboxypeptidase regulatory-like domain-containing protein [Bacteroidaceae bacterium]
MKTVLTSLLLLVSAALLAQRQNVSGQISGPEGRIPNVSVREVDANHRVYNHTRADRNGLFSFTVRDAQHSLQFFAPGYRTFTHKMLGNKSFRVTLEPRRTSPFIGHEKLLLKSDRLFCGIYMGTEVRQMAWVEQMTDTLFTLILPIKMDMIIDEYPAGRQLLVLSGMSQQVMQWENVVDAYPIDVAPHDIHDHHLAQSYFGADRLLNGQEDNTPLYAYPHFQFTKSQLEYLVSHPNMLQRLAVDTYKADNYWNLYPTDQTVELLKKVLEKAQTRPGPLK